MIQFSLRKFHYHRVHCPVDGTIESIHEYMYDEFFAGSESMTIISIKADFGSVKMLMIGEWCVQSFRFGHRNELRPKVGQHVEKLYEFGHFSFGSQVILIVPERINLVAIRGENTFP